MENGTGDKPELSKAPEQNPAYMHSREWTETLQNCYCAAEHLGPLPQNAVRLVPHFEEILIINRNNRHGPDIHPLHSIFPTL